MGCCTNASVKLEVKDLMQKIYLHTGIAPEEDLQEYIARLERENIIKSDEVIRIINLIKDQKK